MRLLEDFGKLGNSSIFFWQVVERVQDLCDQLNIIIPHSFQLHILEALMGLHTHAHKHAEKVTTLSGCLWKAWNPTQ